MVIHQIFMTQNSVRKHKWKDKLISSSLPLEFEAAQILISKKFWITADYTYARTNESGISTDFSVDINANIYTPYLDPNEVTSSLELLIECKQRSPDHKWLFLPDINKGVFSPITLGRTLHAIDEFSSSFLDQNATVDFDKRGPFCYKGIEIDERTGNVHDSEIKHGISQLQYALPRLISNGIRSYSQEMPFFFCPILLTTSKLMILNRGVKIDGFEKMGTIEEIAKPVPYLYLYSDFGPGFQKYCEYEFSWLKDNKSWTSLDKYRLERGEWDFQLPSNLSKALSMGRESGYFQQFVVCSLDYFPVLLNRIKKITAKAVENMSNDHSFNLTIQELEEKIKSNTQKRGVSNEGYLPPRAGDTR